MTCTENYPILKPLKQGFKKLPTKDSFIASLVRAMTGRSVFEIVLI